MKRKTRVIGLIIGVILLTIGFITPIQADETDGTTTPPSEFGDVPVIQLFIVTDGDFITIGDDDILGALQAGIDGLGGQIVILNNKLNNAQETADSANGLAATAYIQALNNKGELNKQAQTLIVQYDKVNDSIEKIWILRDELVAFEGAYFSFVNETNGTLGDLQFGQRSHEEELLLQGEDIEALQAKLNGINNVVALVRNTLITLGVLAFGLFLFNRKYPFGQIIRNGKNSFKNSKQHTIVDFIPKAKKAKAHHTILYKLTHIHRHSSIKAKSMKNAVKHRTYHIKRNPQKSPLQFMFSFFNKL